ncbi:MAG: clan AA aspartic protease [Archaeoglobaceae archaeon]
MNFLLQGVPFLEVSIENPFMELIYPENGKFLAIFDTGYEGFALLPKDIFKELKFDELQLEERKLMLPDGSLVRSRGTFGNVRLGKDTLCDGFIETSDTEEVVLGIEFARRFRFVLDYCSNRFEVQKC